MVYFQLKPVVESVEFAVDLLVAHGLSIHVLVVQGEDVVVVLVLHFQGQEAHAEEFVVWVFAEVLGCCCCHR